MNNFGIIIAVIVIGFIGGTVYLSSQNKVPEIEITATQDEILTIDADDHVQGNADSDIVLFEYSDFECPACAAYHPIVKEVLVSHGDSFAYVSRNFPLHFHPNARNASLAVESAALQGKYVEMADLLFEDQAAWRGKPGDKDIFIPYAEQLGLDVEEWQTQMNNEEIQLLVDNDAAEGRSLGVAGTPTFFLNGEKISFNSPDQLVDLINQAGSSPSEEEGADTATTTQ